MEIVSKDAVSMPFVTVGRRVNMEISMRKTFCVGFVFLCSLASYAWEVAFTNTSASAYNANHTPVGWELVGGGSVTMTTQQPQTICGETGLGFNFFSASGTNILRTSNAVISREEIGCDNVFVRCRVLVQGTALNRTDCFQIVISTDGWKSDPQAIGDPIVFEEKGRTGSEWKTFDRCMRIPGISSKDNNVSVGILAGSGNKTSKIGYFKSIEVRFVASATPEKVNFEVDGNSVSDLTPGETNACVTAIVDAYPTNGCVGAVIWTNVYCVLDRNGVLSTNNMTPGGSPLFWRSEKISPAIDAGELLKASVFAEYVTDPIDFAKLGKKVTVKIGGVPTDAALEQSAEVSISGAKKGSVWINEFTTDKVELCGTFNRVMMAGWKLELANAATNFFAELDGVFCFTNNMINGVVGLETRDLRWVDAGSKEVAELPSGKYTLRLLNSAGVAEHEQSVLLPLVNNVGMTGYAPWMGESYDWTGTAMSGDPLKWGTLSSKSFGAVNFPEQGFKIPVSAIVSVNTGTHDDPGCTNLSFVTVVSTVYGFDNDKSAVTAKNIVTQSVDGVATLLLNGYCATPEKIHTELSVSAFGWMCAPEELDATNGCTTVAQLRLDPMIAVDDFDGGELKKYWRNAGGVSWKSVQESGRGGVLQLDTRSINKGTGILSCENFIDCQGKRSVSASFDFKNVNSTTKPKDMFRVELTTNSTWTGSVRSTALLSNKRKDILGGASGWYRYQTVFELPDEFSEGRKIWIRLVCDSDGKTFSYTTVDNLRIAFQDVALPTNLVRSVEKVVSGQSSDFALDVVPQATEAVSNVTAQLNFTLNGVTTNVPFAFGGAAVTNLDEATTAVVSADALKAVMGDLTGLSMGRPFLTGDQVSYYAAVNYYSDNADTDEAKRWENRYFPDNHKMVTVGGVEEWVVEGTGTDPYKPVATNFTVTGPALSVVGTPEVTAEGVKFLVHAYTNDIVSITVNVNGKDYELYAGAATNRVTDVFELTTGLEGGKTYVFKVVGTDKDGNTFTTAAAQGSFTTLAAAATKAPTIAKGETNVVAWAAKDYTPATDGNAEGTEYAIRVTTSAGGDTLAKVGGVDVWKTLANWQKDPVTIEKPVIDLEATNYFSFVTRNAKGIVTTNAVPVTTNCAFMMAAQVDKAKTYQRKVPFGTVSIGLAFNDPAQSEDATAEVEYKVGSGAWTAVCTPFAISLKDLEATTNLVWNAWEAVGKVQEKLSYYLRTRVSHGNRSSGWSEEFVGELDFVPPQGLKIEGTPEAGVVTNGTEFSFTASTEETKPITYLWETNGVSIAEASPTLTGTAIEGTNTVSVYAMDDYSNVCSAVARTWVVDTKRPAWESPAITGEPANNSTNNASAFNLTAHATDATRLRFHWSLFRSDEDVASPTEGAHSKGAVTEDVASPTGGAPSKGAATKDVASPTGGAVDVASPTGGANFTGTVTEDGTYTVRVYATDEAGNVSTTNNWCWTRDTTPPTDLKMEGTPAANVITKDSAVNLTASAKDTTVLTYHWKFNGTESVGATLTTPSQEGKNTATVYAKDALGNVCDPISRSWTLDTVPPAVTAFASKTFEFFNQTPMVASVTFSEPVTNFTADCVTVGNGAVVVLAGDEKGAAVTPATVTNEYTLVVTPTVEGAVSIQIEAGKVTDLAGNVNAKATEVLSRTYDITPPEVTELASDTPQFFNRSVTFTVTATFSEPVTNFTAKSLTVGNGTPSEPKLVKDNAYTFTIEPVKDGPVTVQIKANTVDDRAGNKNTKATEVLSRTCDVTPPEVVEIAGPAYFKTSPFKVAVAFSENVTNVTAAAFTVGNGTVTKVLVGDGETEATATTATNRFAVVIAPTAEGAVTVEVEAGKVFDLAANPNEKASKPYAFTYDCTAPTVALASDTPGFFNKAPLVVTATFSEPVTNVTKATFTAVNGTVASVEEAGGNAYTVTVTPGDATGAQEGIAVTVQVAAGAVADFAGNPNVASDVLARTYDVEQPSVELTSKTPQTFNEYKVPLTVTVTFDEPVTNFTKACVSVENGEVTNVTIGAEGNLPATAETVTNVFTVAINPRDEEEGEAFVMVSVQVKAGAVTDRAGNGNKASGVLKRKNVTKMPTVTLDSATPAHFNDQLPFTVTATFVRGKNAEPAFVTNFTAASVSVANGTVTDVKPLYDPPVDPSAATNIYTFTVVPAAEGEITVQIPAGVVVDVAGNANEASDPLTRTYDNTPPTVPALSGIPVSTDLAHLVATNGTSFALTATATDAISEVTKYHWTLNDAPWDQTLATYSGDVAEGTNTVVVFAEDAAGNCGAAVTNRWVVDMSKPEWAKDPITGTPAKDKATQETGFDLTAHATDTWTATTCHWALRGSDGDVASPTAGAVDVASPTTGARFSGTVSEDDTYTASVYVTDEAGNVSTTNTWSWTVDREAPKDLTISGSPKSTDPANPVITSETSFKFGSSATDRTAIAYYWVTNGVTVAAATNEVAGTAVEGTNMVIVVAKDEAGNVCAPVTNIWIVDTTPPQKPDFMPELCRPAMGGVTNATDNAFAIYAITNDLTTVTYHWRLVKDGQPVGEEYAAEAPQGLVFIGEVAEEAGVNRAYAAMVWAVDAAGNVSTTNSWSWTYDTVAPVLDEKFGGTPADGAVTKDADYNLTMGSTKKDVTYFWTLRGSDGDVASPTTGARFTGTVEVEGVYTAMVYAVDCAGNVSATNAMAWVYDKTPPAISDISGTPWKGCETNLAHYALSASSNDKSTTTNRWALVFDEKVVAEGEAASGNGVACLFEGDVGAKGEGVYTAMFWAVDAAGNVSATNTWSWTYDATPPVLDEEFGGAPADGAVTNGPNYALTMGVDKPEGVAYHWALVTNNMQYVKGWTAGGATFAGAVEADGVYTAMVYTVDRAGNVSTTNTMAWTYDTTPPQKPDFMPELCRPAMGGATNATDNAFAIYAITNDLTTVTYHWQLVKDGQPVGEEYAAEAPQGLVFIGEVAEEADVNRAYTAMVWAVDAAGNVSATNSWSWTYDTVAPTVTLATTTPEPPFVFNRAHVFKATVTFSKPMMNFTKDSVTVANGEVTNVSEIAKGTYEIMIAPSADGDVTVRIEEGAVKDLAGNGNVASAALTRTCDITPPTATLESDMPAAFNWDYLKRNNFIVTVTFSEPVANFTERSVTVDNVTQYAVGKGEGNAYQVSIVSMKGDGPVTIRIAAGVVADAAGNGNAASEALTRVYDNTPPKLHVTGTPANGATTSLKTFDLTAEATNELFDVTYYWYLNGVYQDTAGGNALAGNAQMGPNKVEVYAEDVLGNATETPFTYTWTVVEPTNVDFGGGVYVPVEQGVTGEVSFVAVDFKPGANSTLTLEGFKSSSGATGVEDIAGLTMRLVVEGALGGAVEYEPVDANAQYDHGSEELTVTLPAAATQGKSSLFIRGIDNKVPLPQ